jgi:O-antigen/teichoic acid export membrane protein
VFGTLGVLPRVIFRVEGQVPTFFRLSLAQTLLAATISVGLLIVGGWGPLAPIVGMLVAEAVFSAVYLRHLWPHLALVLDRPTARRALKFGLPSIAVTIGLWAIKTSDRFLLQHFTSLAVVGLYSAACSVSKIGLDLVGNAVNWAVVPFVYATLKRVPEHRAKPTLARLATYNVAVLVALGLATVLYARELIYVFASATFAEAASVVPLVTVASMIQMLNYIPSRGIGYREKTFYFPLIVGAGAAVSLSLNVALIPTLGMHGAAIAALAGQAVCMALTIPISQRLYPIPYEWGRLFRLFLAAAATALVAWLLPDTWGIPYQAVKAALLLGFPGLLLVSGFFTDAEIRVAHLRVAAALRGLTRREGRVGALAGLARRLLAPLALAVHLGQFVAGQAGGKSGSTVRERLREAWRIVETSRAAGLPRAWRRARTLGRAVAGTPVAAAVDPDGRPEEEIS